MIIGVTGSFGSGKSTVSRILAKKMRARLIDADKMAAGVLKGEKKRIEKEFGTADRRKLGAAVFDDARKLNALKGIIHPRVLKAMKKDVEKAKGSVVLDVPLLIETNAHKMADAVVVVCCEEGQRIKRLRKKGFSPRDIKARTRYQMPIGKKLRRADYVIDNSSSVKNTKKQIELLYKNLMKRSV